MWNVGALADQPAQHLVRNLTAPFGPLNLDEFDQATHDSLTFRLVADHLSPIRGFDSP